MMNVHFNSSKQREPDKDNGKRVIYGPSKRMGYQLRWYLILALVGRVAADMAASATPQRAGDVGCTSPGGLEYL